MIHHLDYLANAIFLAVVCAACVAHVNKMQQAPFCERVGFVFTAAASFASSGWYVGALIQWPGIDDAARYVDFFLYLGLAFIALAIVRGELRRLLARARGAWDGIDRRGSVPESIAALTAEDLDHRLAPDELAGERFQRRR